MITVSGYSKNPSLLPEGIVITFGKEMINDHGGLLWFLRDFLNTMKNEENGWCHKLKNKPTVDVDIVYIIIANRLAYKCFQGGFQHFKFIGEKANAETNSVDWPGIYLAGPVEKCPFKRVLKGFQGFRYCTKLF